MKNKKTMLLSIGILLIAVQLTCNFVLAATDPIGGGTPHIHLSRVTAYADSGSGSISNTYTIDNSYLTFYSIGLTPIVNVLYYFGETGVNYQCTALTIDTEQSVYLLVKYQELSYLTDYGLIGANLHVIGLNSGYHVEYIKLFRQSTIYCSIQADYMSLTIIE